MERLGDHELLYIFNKIPYHTSSLIQVSKRFMKVACVDLEYFRSSVPDLLFDILPSSPNITQFTCCKPLLNSHLQLLALSCPKLHLLQLGIPHSCPNLELLQPQDLHPSSSTSDSDSRDFDFDFDFGDEGLCALGSSCSDLRGVYLSRRLHVKDAGIVSVVTSCRNLIRLDLEGCVGVADESLKAVGESGIRYLNLGGCYLITDLGLEYLGIGDLKNCLQHLDLSGCDRISDNGVIHLKHMVGLTQLKLSKCGVRVTDSVIVDLLPELLNIEKLDLSWLVNVTDVSLLTVGGKCLKLEEVNLTGCEAITAKGLHAFSGHESLKSLMLFSCYNFSWEEVESVALTCVRLQHLGLMKRIKTPMPKLEFDYIRIGDNSCGIGWDEDINIPYFW